MIQSVLFIAHITSSLTTAVIRCCHDNIMDVVMTT